MYYKCSCFINLLNYKCFDYYIFFFKPKKIITNKNGFQTNLKGEKQNLVKNLMYFIN